MIIKLDNSENLALEKIRREVLENTFGKEEAEKILAAESEGDELDKDILDWLEDDLNSEEDLEEDTEN